MTYVLDTSSWQQLFGCYNRARFPSLWKEFEGLVARLTVSSVEQVFNEIERRDKNNGELEWSIDRRYLFPKPTNEDSQFLTEIYRVPRFRHVIPVDLRDPHAAADPFLIARAKSIGGMVVTQERVRGSRVTIPSICSHFRVPCGTLDDLMDSEGWIF